VGTPLKVFLILMAFGGAAGGPAHAQSRQIVGTAGFLSEWEVKGAVVEKVAADRREFSGPVTLTHVGLCSVNGPEEKRGEIKLQIQRAGSLSRINATITLENGKCTYSGHFSDNTSGVMDCSDAKGVPLAFSLK
jgi:hypothetical protein